MGADEIAVLRPNRAAIVFLVTVGALIGFAPATFALSQSRWLAFWLTLGLSLIAGVSSATSLRKFTTAATERPSLLEFALAGLGAVSPTAFAGLMWLLIHVIIYKIAQVFGASNPQLISLRVTLPLAVIFAWALADNFDAAKYLYPNTAGVKSAYYPLITQQRKALVRVALVLLAILAIGSAIFIASGHVGTWFCVFLEAYLFIVGTIVLPTEQRATRPRVDMDAIKRVANILKSAGYEVEQFPRTQKAEVDPLLLSLDLLAQRHEDSIAIEVKTRSESDELVDWKTLSGLRTAAWALSDARGLPRASMRIMLMLLEAKADKSLKLAADRESTLLVNLTGGELSRLETAGADLQQTAVSHWMARLETAAIPSRIPSRARHERKRAPSA